MVSVVASIVVDCVFEPRTDQANDYIIGICCFSDKHAANNDVQNTTQKTKIEQHKLHQNPCFIIRSTIDSHQVIFLPIVRARHADPAKTTFLLR
jgi:hypothetical protein